MIFFNFRLTHLYFPPAVAVTNYANHINYQMAFPPFRKYNTYMLSQISVELVRHGIPFDRTTHRQVQSMEAKKCVKNCNLRSPRAKRYRYIEIGLNNLLLLLLLFVATPTLCHKLCLTFCSMKMKAGLFLSLSLFLSQSKNTSCYRFSPAWESETETGRGKNKKKTMEKLWKTKQTCNCPNINKWLGPTALASLRQICLLSVLRIHYPSYIKWSCCGLIPSRLGSAPPHPQLVSEVRTW